jgi:hypothetical protein
MMCIIALSPKGQPSIQHRILDTSGPGRDRFHTNLRFIQSGIDYIIADRQNADAYEIDDIEVLPR